jgi:hypothetical protein
VLEHPFFLNKKTFKPLSLNQTVLGEKDMNSTDLQSDHAVLKSNNSTNLPPKSNNAVLKSNNTSNLPSQSSRGLERQFTLPENDSGIPNFTTCRLKPIVQQTKTGRIEITSTLDVLMDFKSEADVTGISGDGMRISIYRRLLNRAIDISNPSAVYNIKSLPSGYHKKIRYASRFVELVRSKTPKVYKY